MPKRRMFHKCLDCPADIPLRRKRCVPCSADHEAKRGNATRKRLRQRKRGKQLEQEQQT